MQNESGSYVTEGSDEEEWEGKNLVNFYCEADLGLDLCANRSIPSSRG